MEDGRAEVAEEPDFRGRAFVLVIFTIILINHSVQVMRLARGVHPVLGDAVLWALVFVYSALLLKSGVDGTPRQVLRP
jgi:hypothetical protein